jgi:hypothetical protein
MNKLKLSLGMLLVAVSCNGRLTIPEGTPGFAATAGADRNYGSAGTSGSGAGANGGGSAAGSAGTIQRGGLGQACIPGGLVNEADASPAKAAIRTLERCREGLSCNTDGECVPAPDCPQSNGLCVIRRASVNGSGGTGGEPPPGAAGSPYVNGGNGQVLLTVAENGVVALRASESHVYWLEYGTRDALGNYLHDGALMSYSTVDGATTTLAAALEGPKGLELTTSHAYVQIDGAPLIGSPTRPQLLRVPLDGGSASLVQDETRPVSFAAADGQAFWTASSDEVYSMLSDSKAVPSVFLSEYANALASDGTALYYATRGNVLMHTPIASAAPSAVGVSADAFALYEGGIFTLESLSEGSLLSRAPKSGGAFQRVRALGAGSARNLRVVGDRYFVAVRYDGPGPNGTYVSRRQVLTANFEGSDPPIRLLDRPNPQFSNEDDWVGTANALYWSDGAAIYEQPLSTP